MIILGKTNDDKGKQLETITRDILERMRCKNIQVNFISSGGEEIDVAADYPLPSVGTVLNRRLICECKAHSRPVDLPTWQKFLGMIYSEEARIGSEISGCFISLSGVNGNVSGHYDELRKSKPNVNLVTGDALLTAVTSIYSLCDVEIVRATLERFTKRQYRALEVTYYNRNLCWVVIFQDDAYTIIDSAGSPLEAAPLAELKTLVETVLPIRPYVALKEEAEAQRRKLQSMKSVIAQLITNGGRIKLSDLKSGPPFNFREADFQRAAEELVNEGWIVESDDGAELHFEEANESQFYSNLIKTYRVLLGGETTGFDLLEVMKSTFYGTHMNEYFLSQIQAIQGGLPLTTEDIEVAIKLITWSPSALLWAIQPDPTIVTHRKASDTITAAIDHSDRNLFIRRLYEKLRYDLSHHIERVYLLDTFNFREIQTQQKVIIKSGQRIELEVDLNERIGLGYVGEGLTGPDGTNTILLQLLESASEPWDVAAWNPTTTASEPEEDRSTQQDTS